MTSAQVAIAVVVIPILLGALGAGVKAMIDRRNLKASATEKEASATAVLAAAARELVDPLRKELKLEREEHAKEIAEIRVEVKELKSDLAECRAVVRSLRTDIAKERLEKQRLRARVVELETFHADNP